MSFALKCLLFSPFELLILCVCFLSYAFFRFPLKSPKVLVKWIKFTNRGANWKPSRWNSICSRHFDKSNFREYLSRKCLKKDAIPTIIMKSNISYETYHLTTTTATTTTGSSAADSPDDTRTMHSEPEDYIGHVNDEGKLETSELVEICRLCGDRADSLTCNPLHSLDEPDIEQMFRKCLPAINLNANSDQSRTICVDCVAQLKQYSNFIDKILLYQRELGAADGFDSFTASENGLVYENAAKFPIKSSTPNATVFIKQEPIHVKQEKVDSSNRRPLNAQLPMTSPSLFLNPFADLMQIKGSIQQENIKLAQPPQPLPPPPKLENSTNSTYCCACDRIFGNCFEYRTHKCAKSEACADRELGNNCEIMEIITINNPVCIDLAEDENAIALESRPLKMEIVSEQERKERMEFEHAYAKRATSYGLKQEILDSNVDSGESGCDEAAYAHEEDDANQIYFECHNCNQSFVSQALLDDHSTQMHYYPAIMKTCAICNAEFKSSIEYLIHKNKMHTQRHQCRQCKRKFSTEIILRSHERLCARESKDFCFSCRHCGKIIRNLTMMRKHLKSCSGKQTEAIDATWRQQFQKGNVLRLKQFVSIFVHGLLKLKKYSNQT